MTPENNRPRKNIVIVGGSLTGLMTAISLLRLGHKVTVLERTPSSSLIDQGAGIASIPSLAPILTALSALSNNPNTISPLVDFFNEFDRTKTPFSCGELKNLRWLNNKGEVKNEVSARLAAGLREGLPGSGGCSWDLLYTILRANFDGGLEGSYVLPAEKFESDGEANYLDDVEVTSLRENGDQVEILYSEGSLMADFVVGADGPSSVVRKLLLPEEGRKYVGYVAWRGTVKETELSKETRELLNDHVGIYQGKGTQVILYRIPGLNGSIKEGEQLMNMVWYTNHENLKEILTDSDGVRHKLSLGVGKIHHAVRQQQLERAFKTLPPPLFEIWSKIQLPFIQAITDSLSSRAVFMNGKVVLAGDALAGFRPHTTAGTAQGAMHALLLKDVFVDNTDVEEWERKVLGFAKLASGVGRALGTQSQFGKHPMADDEVDVDSASR